MADELPSPTADRKRPPNQQPRRQPQSRQNPIESWASTQVIECSPKKGAGTLGGHVDCVVNSRPPKQVERVNRPDPPSRPQPEKEKSRRYSPAQHRAT